MTFEEPARHTRVDIQQRQAPYCKFGDQLQLGQHVERSFSPDVDRRCEHEKCAYDGNYRANDCNQHSRSLGDAKSRDNRI